MKLSLILHNIRSIHNVGAIFRTADAAGVEKIYTTGYTPQPLDRFARIRPEIMKTALGAEVTVPFAHVVRLPPLIAQLKKEGFTIVALEQWQHSVDYKKIKSKGKVALILGNEVDGISEEILEQCDIVAEIPMKGKKESLNVSVAAGIIVFRLLGI